MWINPDFLLEHELCLELHRVQIVPAHTEDVLAKLIVQLKLCLVPDALGTARSTGAVTWRKNV